jgi:predicted DNA-binding transcriptional regulator AlpA
MSTTTVSTNEPSDKPRTFLTAPQVCARYGIADMSLWRWLRDPEMKFPQPTMVLQRRRFWDEAILREWELSRIGPRAKTGT